MYTNLDVYKLDVYKISLQTIDTVLIEVKLYGKNTVYQYWGAERFKTVLKEINWNFRRIKKMKRHNILLQKQHTESMLV